jgi:hypothetical protein
MVNNGQNSHNGMQQSYRFLTIYMKMNDVYFQIKTVDGNTFCCTERSSSISKLQSRISDFKENLIQFQVVINLGAANERLEQEIFVISNIISFISVSFQILP